MMQWVIDHIGDLIEISSMVVAIAAIIASATPTPKDDGIVNLLRKIVDFLAFNFGNAKNAQGNSSNSGGNPKSTSNQAGKK
ncbi:MAG: hypothetical protein ACRDD7_02960 [Peptostreptococcaceae bacterium]